MDHEVLFTQWVEITSMPALESGRLEETSRREIARLDRSIKVVYIIIVVCRTGVSYFGNRRGPRVAQIGGRRIEFGKRVVRNGGSCHPPKGRLGPPFTPGGREGLGCPGATTP